MPQVTGSFNPLYMAADTVAQQVVPVDSDSIEERSIVLDALGDSSNALLDPVMQGYDEILGDTTGGESFFSSTESPYDGKALPYSMGVDDGISSVLTGCIVLLVFLVVNLRQTIHQQAKDFFMPPHKHFEQLSFDTQREGYMLVLMHFLLSVVLGVVATYYFNAHLQPDEILVHPHRLMWGATGCLAAYFGVKFLLYRFTNWVFFDGVKNFNWNESYFFLISIETIYFLPFAFLTIYSGWPYDTVLVLGVFIALVIKSLLIYKTKVIFFSKFCGFLHFIAYLCTLEVLPMLTLYEVLHQLAIKMIIKN